MQIAHRRRLSQELRQILCTDRTLLPPNTQPSLTPTLTLIPRCCCGAPANEPHLNPTANAGPQPHTDPNADPQVLLQSISMDLLRHSSLTPAELIGLPGWITTCSSVGWLGGMYAAQQMRAGYGRVAYRRQIYNVGTAVNACAVLWLSTMPETLNRSDRRAPRLSDLSVLSSEVRGKWFFCLFWCLCLVVCAFRLSRACRSSAWYVRKISRDLRFE